ncbi:MAG: hypothetical protein A3J12_04420 [Omnitrophica bacterium RIFCSPLOWO2_02_FULL_44_11]|nr:MAG: hypothetical protein A3J12_04420 [Omnitrophica bacterium RIFCSPLOWO2_02_FULL_44_11]
MKALRSPPSEEMKPIFAGIICGALALLLQAGVDTTLHNLQSAFLIWFFLGLLNAISNIKQNEEVKAQTNG